MLSCRDVTNLISQSFDRDLPFLIRIELRIHLLMCRFCREYFKQLRIIRNIIKNFNDRIESNENLKLSDEIKIKIRKCLFKE